MFDATSDRVVLAYVGDGRPISDTPARDLTENDLCRLAHRRALAAVGQDVGRPIDPENPDAGVIKRPDPHHPDPDLVETVHQELLASGHFVAEAPDVPRGKATKPVKAAEASEPEKEA